MNMNFIKYIVVAASFFSKILESSESYPKTFNAQICPLKIKEHNYPFNSSIAKYKDGYVIAFRLDLKNSVKFQDISYFTRIGIVKLDENFNQISDCVILKTRSLFSEDPRIINYNGKWILIYNDKINKKKDRGIYFAELDENLESVTKIYKPFFQNNDTEKNWIPFVSEDGFLNISYQLNPHTIYRLKYNDQNLLVLDRNKKIQNKDLKKLTDIWESKFGQMRGGTPALDIGDHFLSFFHSSKELNDKYTYFFGAVTYSKTPPFNITKVSPKPIYFEDIYDSPLSPFADPKKIVIFPCGIAISPNEEEIIVSCGENDSATKIIKFCKQELLDSLIDIKAN